MAKFFIGFILMVGFILYGRPTTVRNTSVSNPGFLVVKDTTIKGKVVGIMDGDTFKLLTKDSTLIKVRLANIDCPEKKQPFSAKAKQFTSDAIFNKMVSIRVLKKDRYRRYIANVIYNDTLILNRELVKNGLAWHYIKYSKDTVLQGLEEKARVEKVGLWQDENAMPPWQWREDKKKKKSR